MLQIFLCFYLIICLAFIHKGQPNVFCETPSYHRAKLACLGVDDTACKGGNCRAKHDACRTVMDAPPEKSMSVHRSSCLPWTDTSIPDATKKLVVKETGSMNHSKCVTKMGTIYPICMEGIKESREEVSCYTYCKGKKSCVINQPREPCVSYTEACIQTKDDKIKRVSTSKTSKACMPWSEVSAVKTTPEGAKENFCFIPDDDPGGPWCFVNASIGIIKAYCFNVCSKVTCGAVQLPHMARVAEPSNFDNSMSSRHSAGTHVLVACVDGNLTNGTTELIANPILFAQTIRCKMTGDWEILKCMSPCKTLRQLPSNARIITPEHIMPSFLPVGITVSITCASMYLDNYRTSQTVQCKPDGSWNGTFNMNCAEAFCTINTLHQEAVVDGKHSFRVPFNSSIELKCQQEHYYWDDDNSRAKIIKCLPDRSFAGWNKKARCTLRNCANIPKVENADIIGRFNGNNHVGATVTIQCKLGYWDESKHGDSMVCKATGQWTKSKLSCQKRQCTKVPTPIPNGAINYSTPGEVHFECYDGYQLKGASVLPCPLNGIIYGALPKCSPMRADPCMNRYGSDRTKTTKKYFPTMEGNGSARTKTTKKYFKQNTEKAAEWSQIPACASITENKHKIPAWAVAIIVVISAFWVLSVSVNILLLVKLWQKNKSSEDEETEDQNKSPSPEISKFPSKNDRIGNKAASKTSPKRSYNAHRAEIAAWRNMVTQQAKTNTAEASKQTYEKYERPWIIPN